MEKQNPSQYTDVLKDKKYIWQLEHSLLPKAKFSKQEVMIDKLNECDTNAFKRLGEIKQNIDTFVEESRNLYICGGIGNGKTSWAIKILQKHLYLNRDAEYFDNLVQGLFISVPKLIANVKDFTTRNAKDYLDYVKSNIERVNLVIWDDFALEETTMFDRLQLYVFLNDRILAEKSNIFTSNITNLEGLEKIVGKRIASRSYDISEIITLNGKGVR